MAKPALSEEHEILIKYGDKGPLVAVVQILLEYAGLKLEIDGCFGGETKDTVRKFQRTQKVKPVKLTADGDVGNHTWKVLTAGLNLNIHNFAVRIPQQLRKYNISTDGMPIADMEDQNIEILKSMGAEPQVFECVRDCARTGLNELAFQMEKKTPVILLRLWSHAWYGSIAFGPWVVPYTPRPQNSLNSKNIDQLAVQRLKPFFSPLGSLEIRGCAVAGGADGPQFTARLASLLEVPVRANTHVSLDGSAATRMEDESLGCVTATYPNGQTLKEWAKRAREEFLKTLQCPHR